jgi:hypothetical protein
VRELGGAFRFVDRAQGSPDAGQTAGGGRAGGRSSGTVRGVGQCSWAADRQAANPVMLSEFAGCGGAGFVAQRGYSTPGESVAGGSFLSRYGSGSGTADLANQNLPAVNGLGGLGSRRGAAPRGKIPLLRPVLANTV